MDAVSALFMQQSIINDYVIENIVGAQTGWINTYPTKQFYMDPKYIGEQPAVAPFNTTVAPNVGACEHLYFTSYNREQDNNFF